jgi:hypothetical protein
VAQASLRQPAAHILHAMLRAAQAVCQRGRGVWVQQPLHT